MKVRALSIDGAWEFIPVQHGDDRGRFLEWFRLAELTEATGATLPLAQANISVSKRGVARGIHYADVPPSQAKYVTCTYGALMDVIVDIRVGSPTFGAVECVQLDDIDRRCVYISEGLGHAFVALSDNATLTYLVSEPYNPPREHSVLATDPAIGIPWPDDLELTLSARDAEAPTLAEALERGLLPSYDVCQEFYAERRRTSGQ